MRGVDITSSTLIGFGMTAPTKSVKSMPTIEPYVPPPKLEGPFSRGRYSPHYGDTIEDDERREHFIGEHRAFKNAADTGLQRTLRPVTEARDYEGAY